MPCVSLYNDTGDTIVVSCGAKVIRIETNTSKKFPLADDVAGFSIANSKTTNYYKIKPIPPQYTPNSILYFTINNYYTICLKEKPFKKNQKLFPQPDGYPLMPEKKESN